MSVRSLCFMFTVAADHIPNGDKASTLHQSMLLHHHARYSLCYFLTNSPLFQGIKIFNQLSLLPFMSRSFIPSNNISIAVLKHREFVWRVTLLLQWWLSAAIWSRVLCSSLPRGSQGLNKSWFPWYFSPTGDFLSQPGTDDLWCAPEGDEQSKLATFCLWLTLMLHHALYYREPERGRPVCGTEDQRTVCFKLGVWVGWDK